MSKNRIDRILVLGDTHLPFHDMEVLEQAYEFGKRVKAQKVISVGDLSDQKSWSRFMKEPDDDSPTVEWSKTQKSAKELAKLFPKLTIIPGNHCVRYIKKAKEAGIPVEMLKTFGELFPFDGWEWHTNRKPFVLNNTVFLHGDELSGSVAAKAKILGMNVVQGHTHRAAIEYVATFNHKLFAMDVGCMVDPNSKAFDYAAKSLNKVWVGYGYIEDGVPYLFPKS